MMNQIAAKFEVTGLDSIVKIGNFDEIKFSNDLHRIKYIQISS